MGSVCSIDGCGRRKYCRGWCMAHYTRWSRHGDPLAGGRPIGELEAFLQDVVLKHESDECLFWPFAAINGYGVVKRDGKNFYVHRLVCEDEHGPAPESKPLAAHSCNQGHLGCCNRRHLRWASHVENSADSRDAETLVQGERHSAAKLTDEAVRDIRARRGVLSQSELGRIYGVDQTTISEVQLRKTWASVSDTAPAFPWEAL